MQVDHGVSLKKALEMHDLWLEESGVKNTRFVIVTWSDWDCKVMLEMECKWKSLQKPPYFNRSEGAHLLKLGCHQFKPFSDNGQMYRSSL